MIAKNAKRCRVIFDGNVQGVGFRYTARAVSDRYEIFGFVRNLASGQVELVAEGLKDEIDRFLDDLDRKMADYIEHAEVNWHTATGEFSRFEITP